MLLEFKCPRCNNSIKKLVQSIDDIGVLGCLDCGGFLERVLNGPNSSSVEIIDTGFQERPVEYNASQQELRKQVSEQMVREATKDIPD